MNKFYDAMKHFRTEEEAEKFAKAVNSENWGWMKDSKGNIVYWYVECMYEDMIRWQEIMKNA